MKTYKYILNCAVALIFINSCTNEFDGISNTKKNTVIKWITGNYTLHSSYGHYYENWHKADSMTYTGFGYFMDSTNVDTLFRQNIMLRQLKKAVYMQFNVKNQNNNKNIEFKLTKNENNIFTFENAFRDYPSLVTYKILSDTSVNILMQGFKDGEQRNEDFIITKLNKK